MRAWACMIKYALCCACEEFDSRNNMFWPTIIHIMRRILLSSYVVNDTRKMIAKGDHLKKYQMSDNLLQLGRNNICFGSFSTLNLYD